VDYFRFRVDEDDDRRGTFPPSLRASESPIAMACLRLLTVFPDPPDLSWPRFISCIAFSTFEEAFFPYRRVVPLLLELLLVLLLLALDPRAGMRVSFLKSCRTHRRPWREWTVELGENEDREIVETSRSGTWRPVSRPARALLLLLLTLSALAAIAALSLTLTPTAPLLAGLILPAPLT